MEVEFIVKIVHRLLLTVQSMKIQLDGVVVDYIFIIARQLLATV